MKEMRFSSGLLFATGVSTERDAVELLNACRPGASGSRPRMPLAPAFMLSIPTGRVSASFCMTSDLEPGRINLIFFCEIIGRLAGWAD
jgi:hypothetical protein